MKNKKFRELDAFALGLGLTEEELNDWFSSYKAKYYPSRIISTPLCIVYQRQREPYVLEIEENLNPERKKEVAGVQLANGVILLVNRALISSLRVEESAKKFVLNGKCGHIPRLAAFFSKTDIYEESENFRNTLKILRENGLNVRNEYFITQVEKDTLRCLKLSEAGFDVDGSFHLKNRCVLALEF